MRRRIAFGLLGILGVLLGIALILPFFFNVNSYKPQIVTKAKEALGRDVHIDGNLSLSFLPSPKLSIEQAGISNLTDGSPQDFVRIKTLTLSVALLPLLKKQLKIKTIKLHEPEIFLEKLADGRVNWTLSPSEPSTPSSFEVALDRILVYDGRLVYHEKGKNTEIQNINASTTLDALQGPYAISGTLKAFGQNVKVDTKLGALGQSQDVALTIQAGEATSTLEGKLSVPTLTFQGILKASIDPKTFLSSSPQGKSSPLLSEPFRIHAAVAANTTTISLNQANFDIGSAHPTGDLKITLKENLQVNGVLKSLPGQGQCTFKVSPSPQGVVGSLNVATTQAKEFFHWLGIETNAIPSAALGTLAFSTNYTFGDTIHLKNLNLAIRDAKLQGDVSWQPQKTPSSILINLQSPKIETIFKLLGAKDPKPFGASKLKANIQWDATSLHLRSLSGQLGTHLGFTGDVSIDHASVKPKVKATLAFNSITLGALLTSHQVGGSAYPEAKVFLISTPRRASSSPWSDDFIDLSFLNKFDGQFEISASQLRLKDMALSYPALAATLQNGRLDIKTLTASLFDGAFIGNGYITSANALRFHTTLKDANLRNLPPQGATVKIVGGKLFFSSDLSTHGPSLRGMVENLNGSVNIIAKDGMINGFDLHTISQRLGNIQNPASLLGLLTTSMERGQTPFSSFKGDIVFKDGIGTIQSMDLVARGGQGQASGQIDLPRYLLNVRAIFRLTDYPKIPPFHMSLSGSMSNPSRNLDITALQKYMMESVFKGALNTVNKLNPKNLLAPILGDTAPANSNEGESQQQSTANPKQIVKNILKGIF